MASKFGLGHKQSAWGAKQFMILTPGVFDEARP